MESNFLVIYNPANAAALTQEQLSAIQTLTSSEIAQLARRYPNTANQSAYLVLKDKTKADREQLYPLSTWENLYNLHKIGHSQHVAIGFKQHFKRTSLKVAPVQDLTADEVSQAEGLKKMAKAEGVGSPAPLTAPVQNAVESELYQMTKAELQSEYENTFGEKPKAAWGKPALINAIENKIKIEL